MLLNPSIFTGSKPEKDSWEIVNEMEIFFKVMHASDTEGCSLFGKRVAYQLYDEWEEYRGKDVEPIVWEDFTNAFLDHFFLRIEKLRWRILWT